ncbi:MAG: hypothetical protein RIF33_20450 [Cyclobacteriaceae bacterium]
MRNVYHQGLTKVLFFVLILGLFNCSDGDDNDAEPETQPDEIDFTEFSGKYVGTWSWQSPFGFIVDPISLEIAASADNQHAAKFYHTDKFTPKYNSDGVTPEALGTITISDANQVTIDLDLKTDAPQCNGDFLGSGNRTSDGQLVLNMDIVEDCATELEAVFRLVKVADL